MFGDSPSVVVFTIGALAAWGFALWWAFSQPRYRWYHVWLLGLVTFFWWVGESIAIRLGKYEYAAAFTWRLPIPFFGGTPEHPGWIETRLLALLPKNDPRPVDLDKACLANSFDIPFAVVALEAALLFGFFRLCVSLLKSDVGTRMRAALATGGLSALFMVNAFAVLDPVVSTTKWCDPSQANPHSAFLNYGLWTWFTTPTHQGYWFGVPLINYAAWFLAAAVFGFVARYDDERPSGLIRKYRLLAKYVLATIGITIAYFLLLLGSKKVVDWALIHGHEMFFTPDPTVARLWQFGVIVALLGLGVFAVTRGGRTEEPEIDWIAIVPKVLAFAFSLSLLLLEPHLGIFMVWVVTAAIAAVALGWPRLATRLYRRYASRRESKPPGKIKLGA